LDVSVASNPLLDPVRYGERGYPHELWRELRLGRTLARCEGDDFEPFWAVTKHADVTAISKNPRSFLSSPRNTLIPRSILPVSVRESAVLRMLLNMDPPEHGQYRGILARHFTPQALRAFEPRVRELARETVAGVVARARDDGGTLECDFVEDVAVPLPLRVILELLGVPREDAQRIKDWSNRIVGFADPEYAGGAPGIAATAAAQLEMFQYFRRHVAGRAARSAGDLVGRLAEAELDGRTLGEKELLSYCFLLVTAGNETTRNAITGGVLALCEHPAQAARLRRDPSLLATAADEIVRWTSPIVHFCRTAAEDVELRGAKIRAGDTLVLFYPSANRDEDVFADPFTFDVGRDPNPHLGFGIGEHFCLGASLARLEIAALLGELLQHVREIEIAAPAERLRSSFVGGIKRARVRLRVV
jgi:cytochrome P450